jgi:menaquinone-dependent protoporphyrinogen oxidase
MNEKILITYASRAGSTAGVADAIGKTLADARIQAEVLPMQDVKDLSAYCAVIAGSAIRGSKWLPEAMQFLRVHQAELKQVPFAAFMVCITLAMPGAEKYRQGVREWMSPVRSLVHPVSEGYFAGALDFNNLPLTPNVLLMRLAVALRIFPLGDHRDWKVIRVWAENLGPQLV